MRQRAIGISLLALASGLGHASLTQTSAEVLDTYADRHRRGKIRRQPDRHAGPE
jgi:hypothetical protein